MLTRGSSNKLRPWQLLATVAALATMASTSFADETDPVLWSLEEQVWTTSEQGLLDLELNVVKQIQIDAYNPFAFYLLAHLRLREFTNAPEDLALVKQAAELAQQAIDLRPSSDVGYVALAETLDLMGQSQRGVELLESAATAGVEPSWRIAFTLARLNAETGSKEKILGLLEQALAAKPTQTSIIVPYVVAVLQTTTQDTELLIALHDWNRKFPNILFQQTIAIAMADSGKYADAHRVYRNIYSREKTYTEAMVNDAIILYRNLKQPREAIALLQKVLQQKPKGHTDADVLTTVHSHLGAAFLRNGQISEAEGELIAAARAAQDKLAILDFATKAYRDAGNGKHLSKFLERLTVEISPTGVLYALLGETQSEDLQRHDAALKSFANAILLEPSRSDFYNGMGLTYYRMKRQEDALRLFKEATKIDPNDATARYNEACVLALMGRTQQAIGSLQEALTLDPRLVDNARSDKDFANINGLPEFIRMLKSPATAPALEDDDDEDLLGH